MRKLDFWKSDWFLGVAVVIAVALFARFSDLVPSLERKAYDLGVALAAHSVSSTLPEHFFSVPGWTPLAQVLVLLAVAAYLVLLLPRLGARTALVFSGAAFIVLIALHFMLMTGSRIWMQLMLPAMLLLAGHGALLAKRFIATEYAKLKAGGNSAEENRMLGLAYQGQGRLDKAWDKFRKVPLAESVMSDLYNLALDFERERQYDKAESVFRHMAGFDPKFRDLEQRLARAMQISEIGSRGYPTRA